MSSASSARGRRISTTMIRAASPLMPSSARATVAGRQKDGTDRQRADEQHGDKQNEACQQQALPPTVTRLHAALRYCCQLSPR